MAWIGGAAGVFRPSPMLPSRRLQEKPITPDGKVNLDPAKLTARQDAQEAVLEKGAFGLIVLSGSHDLSESVRRLGMEKCEYLRVITRRFTEFGE